MNELIFLVDIVVTFGLVVLFGKLWGKAGLTTWIALASVLANIITVLTVPLLGQTVTLGTTLFTSVFLATDLLSEKYSKKDAFKGVTLGACSSAALILFTQLASRYTVCDFATDMMGSFQNVFNLSLRISAASIVMYIVSNIADILLFDRLKKMTGGKKVWLRNNISTIICNTLENFGFMFLAFIGIYDVPTVLGMAIATSVIETVLGLLDTPFLYLGLKVIKPSKDEVAAIEVLEAEEK